jgi:hypothetical protein
MEKYEVDIDNFIRERVNDLYPRGFAVDPSPDFAKRTLNRIYRLEKRRYLFVLCGWAILLALGPVILRQLWLLIRNDYFAVGHFPFANAIIVVYQFLLSGTGAFLLLALGVSASLLFVFGTLRGGLRSFAKIVRA